MTAEDLRKSILQQAIQGKLVPQDPKDEPASSLLARIREEKERLVKEKIIKRDKNESIIYRGEDNSYYEKFLATREVKCIDEEIPFEIPQNWVWARIGHLYQHNTGKPLNASNTRGSLKKYLTTSNVYWGNFDFSVVKEMPFTDEEIDKCTVSKGDLLVCEGGDIGRAAVWTYDYNICIQNHIHRLRAYCEICTRYIYNIFWLYKRNGNIGGKGIGIQGLSANALHNILIPVPPFAEQYRIVEKMDMMEPLLEDYGKHKEQVSLLDNNIRSLLCKSVLQYAIQGQLVQQNETDEPVSILLDRIRKEKKKLQVEGKIKKKEAFDSVIFKGEDNKYYEQIDSNITQINDDILFDIPGTWLWATIGDVLQVQTGASFKKEEAGNEGVRILRGGNIVGGTYVFKEDDIFISKELVSEGILLRRNDLITPAVTSIENVGKIARIKEEHHMISAGGFVFILRPFLQDDVLSQYLCYLIKSPAIIERIKAITKKSGSAFYNIGKERLVKIYIPIPPYKEMCRIVAILKELIKSIEG